MCWAQAQAQTTWASLPAPLPLLTPCLWMASRSNWTTSWPSTPLHLKPLVQEMRVLWRQKIQVNPPTTFMGLQPLHPLSL